MNVKLEKSIVKPKRSKLTGNLYEPEWFTKYGRFLEQYPWDTIIVHRPYKFKLTEYRADKLYQRILNANLGIKYLWYALEKDRYNWVHAHLLTCQGDNPLHPNRHDIAKAIKRSVSEIRYFDHPDSQQAISHYSSKSIAHDNVMGYGFLYNQNL